MRAAGLFSANEELVEVPTSHLRFLAADHMLAAALAEVSDYDSRRSHLLRARDLYRRFLQTCERLGLLHEGESRLLATLDSEEEDSPLGPAEDRELRLELLRREKEAGQRLRTLRAFLARLGPEDGDAEEETREMEVVALQSRCRGALRELRLIDEVSRHS